jgi:hypothetical protein
MKQIAAAFVKAQKSFAPALKTNTNPAFKSKYVALDGCIEAVIDALNSNGIALMQPTHEDATGVTVETLFVHESGEVMSGGKLHVPADKQNPQGYGSALTYARRYSLMSSCGIAPEDDDGNAASAQQKPARQMKPLYVSPAQAEQLALLADEVNADLPALFDWISKKTGRKVSTFAELQINEIHPITTALNAKKETT